MPCFCHFCFQVSCDKPNFTTVLKDMSSVGLARGMSQIQGGLDKKVDLIIFSKGYFARKLEFCSINLSQVKRKKVSQLDAERNIASVIPALDYSDFKKV